MERSSHEVAGRSRAGSGKDPCNHLLRVTLNPTKVFFPANAFSVDLVHIFRPWKGGPRTMRFLR